MDKFIQWFKTFFEDNSNGASTMRAMFWLWMIILSFNVTYVNIKAGELKPIPDSYIVLTMGIIGGKVIQRIGEKGDTLTITSTDAKGVTTTKIESPPLNS
jgi:hypothetical protein